MWKKTKTPCRLYHVPGPACRTTVPPPSAQILPPRSCRSTSCRFLSHSHSSYKHLLYISSFTGRDTEAKRCQTGQSELLRPLHSRQQPAPVRERSLPDEHTDSADGTKLLLLLLLQRQVRLKATSASGFQNKTAAGEVCWRCSTKPALAQLTCTSVS